jgi:hypothetical protein
VQLRVLVLEGTDPPEEDSMVKRPRVVLVVVVVGDGQVSMEDLGNEGVVVFWAEESMDR